MARETEIEERERKDREKAEAIRLRQIRLGHVPAPEAAVEEPRPRASRSKKK